MVEWAWVLICLMVRPFFGKIGRFTSIASDVTVFIGTHLYAYSFVMTFFIIIMQQIAKKQVYAE